MSRPSKPVFSNETIELAKDELLHHQRGDDYQCAIMRSHGRSFVLVRSNSGSLGRPGLYGVDEAGQIFPTQTVDGLFSVCDEPDVYHHFDD
jgi:hypothetical protein